MRILRCLVWYLDNFHVAIAAHEDVCHDFLVTVIHGYLALLGKWKMPSLEQDIFRTQVENGRGELLEPVEVVNVVGCLAGFTHDQIRLGDVGRDEICGWEKLVDQCLCCSFRKKL